MQEWWTPAEISASGLPGLPASKRAVNTLVEREGWQTDRARAKRRAGRGGGWSYHYSLFPARAQAAIVSPPAETQAIARPSRDEAWASFDALPEKAKARARAKLATVDAVERLIEGGEPKDRAIKLVARIKRTGTRTIWNWMASIDGVRPEDRLAYLAPRHRTARRKVQCAECAPEAWEWFKAAYLRQGEVLFTACYDELKALAEAHDWQIPSERALRRRVKREIPADVMVLRRKGPKALAALYPAQVRDKSALGAMQLVNTDFHKWDVFVNWGGEIVRPQMCAFADIYSGKILSWRFSLAPNTGTVQLTFGDMVERYGIPAACLMDNGREYASKWFTGGVETRFRNIVKEDEVWGTLPSMGIKVHWALPESGQSKPIERAFQDLCNRVAKDIRFDGAYTGNSPTAKPENYASRAIDFEYFKAVVDEGIAKHNARTGRRSPVAAGRSLDETFAASYAEAAITKATEAQRRFWLLGTKRLRAASGNGQIEFLGNTYWSPWMAGIAGEHVFVRFDPDNLQSGVYVYDSENAFLAHAECHAPEGFLSLEAAKAHAKARTGYRKAVRAASDAEVRLSTTEAGAMLDALAPTPEPHQEAKVIRAAFPTAPIAPPRPEARALDADEADTHAAIIAQFERPKPVEKAPEDAALARYREAIALEARIAAGEAVAPAERDWLRIYQAEPEYRGFAQMREAFGDTVLG